MTEITPYVFGVTSGVYRFDNEIDMVGNPVYHEAPYEKLYDFPGVYKYVEQTEGVEHTLVVLPGDGYEVQSRTETINVTTKTVEIVFDDKRTGSRYSMIYTEEYTAPEVVETLTLEDLNDALIALTSMVIS